MRRPSGDRRALLILTDEGEITGVNMPARVCAHAQVDGVNVSEGGAHLVEDIQSVVAQVTIVIRPIKGARGLLVVIARNREDGRAARFEHPGALTQRPTVVRDVFKDVVAQERGEGMVGEAEMLNIFAGQIDVRPQEICG